MNGQVLGIIVGAIVSAVLVWLTVRRNLGQQRDWARLAADGVQEATILVRNGYHPDTVRVRAGRPVRLVFDRQEEDPCSDRVFLSEPALSRHLAPFAKTLVTFTPHRIGDHLFTCQEGRFRGHLVVAGPVAYARSSPQENAR